MKRIVSRFWGMHFCYNSNTELHDKNNRFQKKAGPEGTNRSRLQYFKTIGTWKW